MGKPINEEVVLEHWNDALRLTASIKTVSVKPSAMLRKLGACQQSFNFPQVWSSKIPPPLVESPSTITSNRQPRSYAHAPSPIH